MRRSAVQPHPHAVNGDTGRACLLPDCSIHNGVLGGAAKRSVSCRAQEHYVLDAYGAWISSLGGHRLTKSGHFFLGKFCFENREPTVAEPRCTAHRCRSDSTDPNGDRALQRQRVNARLRNLMILTIL